LQSGCRVISLSLGVRTGVGAGPDPVYEKIAAVAAESRCLLIAAAGNESAPSVDQPAASTSIMGVTASTRAGVVAIWANRGEPDGRAAVNLTAPGVGIRSAWNDGGYRVLDGTSCATPIVAGIAALYQERHPEMSSDQIWNQMCRTARRLTDPLTRMPLPATAAGSGLVQAPL
jgi:subtilisin family serine protease